MNLVFFYYLPLDKNKYLWFLIDLCTQYAECIIGIVNNAFFGQVYVNSYAVPGVIIGIVYNAFCAVLHTGSRRIHYWHCIQCLLCSTAYGFT